MRNCKLVAVLRPGEGFKFDYPLTEPIRFSFDSNGNAYMMKVLNVFGSLAYPILTIYNTGEYIIFNCIGRKGIFGSRIKNGSSLMGLITDAKEKEKSPLRED